MYLFSFILARPMDRHQKFCSINKFNLIFFIIWVRFPFIYDFNFNFIYYFNFI